MITQELSVFRLRVWGLGLLIWVLGLVACNDDGPQMHEVTLILIRKSLSSFVLSGPWGFRV